MSKSVDLNALKKLYDKYKERSTKWVLIATELGWQGSTDSLRKYYSAHFNNSAGGNASASQPAKPVKLTSDLIDEYVCSLGKRIVEKYNVLRMKEPKQIKTTGRLEEISVLDISDVHYGMINEVFDTNEGKKVCTYSPNIFDKEMVILERSIKEIHRLLSNSYRLRKLIIFVLGDILTNDRIFEGQVFHIAKCVGLQVEDVIVKFAMFFNNMLRLYEKIDVVAVVGNHGRSIKDSQEDEPIENSFEWHIYKTWEKQFADSKRIRIIVPNTKRYIYETFGWRHLIEHGSDIKGFTDNYIQQQIKNLYVNVGGFDVYHYGHFHSIRDDELADKVIIKRNGCWVSKDSYGFRLFKTYSVPKQWFFGVGRKRPVTWQFKIDLRE